MRECFRSVRVYAAARRALGAKLAAAAAAVEAAGKKSETNTEASHTQTSEGKSNENVKDKEESR